MTTRNHANLREGGTELERVAQNKLHEMLIIEYGFVTENVEPMKALLTTYAQKVAEEAVRAERERIKKEITEQTLLNDGDNTFVKLGEALWVCDSKEERAAFMKALAPLPDKE